MDIEANIREIRELLDKGKRSPQDLEDHEQERFFDLVESMFGWMDGGGFPPECWRRDDWRDKTLPAHQRIRSVQAILKNLLGSLQSSENEDEDPKCSCEALEYLEDLLGRFNVAALLANPETEKYLVRAYEDGAPSLRLVRVTYPSSRRTSAFRVFPLEQGKEARTHVKSFLEFTEKAIPRSLSDKWLLEGAREHAKLVLELPDSKEKP